MDQFRFLLTHFYMSLIARVRFIKAVIVAIHVYFVRRHASDIEILI